MDLEQMNMHQVSSSANIMFHLIKSVERNTEEEDNSKGDDYDFNPGDLFVLPKESTQRVGWIELTPERTKKEHSLNDNDLENHSQSTESICIGLDSVARGVCAARESGCQCLSLLDEMSLGEKDVNGNVDIEQNAIDAATEQNDCQGRRDGFHVLEAENEELKVKLAQSQAKLMLLRAENTKLQERSRKEYNDINHSLYSILQQYCDVGQCFERAKMEIKDLANRLEKEKEESSHWKEEYLSLKEKVKAYGRRDDAEVDGQSVEGIDECSLPEDDKLGALDAQLPSTSGSPSTNLSLSCTLCFKKMSLHELESHSKKCSAGVRSEPSTPSAPGMLVSSVTKSSVDSQFETVFKIITKTTLSSYAGTFFQVQRTKDDFVWIWKALKSSCQELVIPPLDLPDHLHGILREMQRFLRRLCSHKTLKENAYVVSFLTGTTKEFEKTKKNTKKKRHMHRQFSFHKPSKEGKSEDGLLMRSQKYVSGLQKQLVTLKDILGENLKNTTNVISLGQCFQEISNGELNNTFLKMATAALAKVSQDIELDQTESDAAVLIENLGSLINYTKCAEQLLAYVGSIIDTFLYWEEEMEVYEEMEKQGSITSSNGVIVTKKWAEATARCNEVKEELERLCDGLSDELFWFDFQKENELKEIFTEYAEGRSEHFEKLKSKWYSVKLMLEMDIDMETRGIHFHSPGPPSN